MAVIRKLARIVPDAFQRYFADRCPQVAEDCRAAVPSLADEGRAHRVRCLHPFDGAQS